MTIFPLTNEAFGVDEGDRGVLWGHAMLAPGITDAIAVRAVARQAGVTGPTERIHGVSEASSPTGTKANKGGIAAGACCSDRLPSDSRNFSITVSASPSSPISVVAPSLSSRPVL